MTPKKRAVPVAGVPERMRGVRPVVRAVARLEDDRLAAADGQLDRALEHVDELLAVVLRRVGHAASFAIDVDHGHHRVLPVGGEHQDLDPLVGEAKRAPAVGAHDLHERGVRLLQRGRRC